MKERVYFFFRRYWILLLFAATKFILQYALVNPYYELHRDEFLHLDQARHLAFGFISVPPLTSLFSRMIFLLGGAEFWIKFFPALFGALTIVITWVIVEELQGKTWSKLVVSSALLFSALVRINLLFQPNSFDILAWTLIFLCLIKYLRTQDKRWLWYLAFFTALGFYNKYNVIFLLAGTGTGLLLTSQRSLLIRPNFLKAVILCLVLILPNIIWQILHHFPVIDHMKVLKANQLDNNSATGFLESQVRIFFGSLPLTLIGLGALLFHKPYRTYRFIGFTFISVMIIFAIMKAKDYYAIGLFPVIFVFAAVYLETALRNRWRSVVFSALVIFNLLPFAAVIRYLMPVMSPEQIIRDNETFAKFGLLRWEDGKDHPLPQDFADMTGWKEMADKALVAYRMIPEAELEKTLVICDNYGQTGALNYYNRGKMKEAYSFNTDYIYWLPRIDQIKNVILVGEMTEEKIAEMFLECRTIGTVENEYAREKGTAIFLFTGASQSFTEFFYNEAEKRKRELDIF